MFIDMDFYMQLLSLGTVFGFGLTAFIALIGYVIRVLKNMFEKIF